MSLSTIFAISVALTTILSISSNALSLPPSSLEAGEKEFKIELIDVKCDKNENGMQVTIEFSQPFDGIIYSQEYFNDPKCRYVSAGEHEMSYNFVVPYEGCGSKPSCAICDSIDNILIIQQDEEVQGEFDAARKISCSRTGLEDEKKIFFKPFIVDMLDVVTVPTSHGDVDCWMDIQRGVYPKLKPVGEIIKIGEALTVLVYLRDEKNEYDLSVRNCWAYDDEDFDDKKTGKVQLSDVSGCTMKKKLFGTWRKTHETGSTGATLLLHNTLRAFKFPDESQVYLKCDIEICRGNCAEAICDQDEINRVDCTLDPLHEKCIRNTLMERNKSPSVGFTTMASTKVPVRSSTVAITTRVPLATRRPSFAFSTTQRPNYISTTTFNQDATTIVPFRCVHGSSDIRCIQSHFDGTTQTPEFTTNAREAITYPNLSKMTPMKPGLEAFCKQYPKNKRCNQRVTDEFLGNVEILTFKPPSPFATVKYAQTTDLPSESLKEATERRADTVFYTTGASEIDAQPFICKGPNLDPRCPNPTPTATPPTYLPPSTTTPFVPITSTQRCYPGSPDPRCPKIATRSTTKIPALTQTTKKFFICVPGSNDINCEIDSTKTTEEPIFAIDVRDPFTTEQPEKSICVLGSRNPECRNVETSILTLKPRPSTTAIPSTTRQFITTTRAPLCYPGSLDPRCPKQTTTKQIFPEITTTQRIVTEIPETTTFQILSTTRAPFCYPGSPDPRCPKIAITERVLPSIGTTQEIQTEISGTTRAQFCYPGSLDPRCTKQTTTKPFFPEKTTKKVITDRPIIVTTRVPFTTNAPRCYPGSLDPRCTQTTTERFVVTNIPSISSTLSPIPSTTRAPFCYPGSPDPRCPKIAITERVFPSISTTQEIQTESPSTTRAPLCYPGSLDPRCPKQITTKRVIPTITTTQRIATETPETSTFKVSIASRGPTCYPGALDPRCVQTTERPFSTAKSVATEKVISTTFKPFISTTKSQIRCYPGSLDPACASKYVVVPLQCGPGYSDPRCPNPTPTAEPATYLPPITTPSFKTRKPSIVPTVTPRITITQRPISTVTTERFRTTATELPESTTRFVTRPTYTTQRPTYTTRPPFSYSTFTTKSPTVTTTFIPQFSCAPNSLDPRCARFTTSKTIPTETTDGLRTPTTESPETTTRIVTTYTTQRTPVTITQRPIYTTTKSPFSFPTITTRTPFITTRFTCTPNSLDPRCRTIITSTPNAPTERIRTESPETTTKLPFTLPTFSTSRTIMSSPRPFTTRAPTKTTSTTTENILCYPGSTIEGCNQTFTTPSYCFPGSTDKRCPQLPPSFSTRQPATYLPPYPDEKLNRVKRAASIADHSTHEVVKFSLSFKPFS